MSCRLMVKLTVRHFFWLVSYVVRYLRFHVSDGKRALPRRFLYFEKYHDVMTSAVEELH